MWLWARSAESSSEPSVDAELPPRIDVKDLLFEESDEEEEDSLASLTIYSSLTSIASAAGMEGNSSPTGRISDVTNWQDLGLLDPNRVLYPFDFGTLRLTAAIVGLGKGEKNKHTLYDVVLTWSPLDAEPRDRELFNALLPDAWVTDQIKYTNLNLDEHDAAHMGRDEAR